MIKQYLLLIFLTIPILLVSQESSKLIYFPDYSEALANASIVEELRIKKYDIQFKPEHLRQFVNLKELSFDSFEDLDLKQIVLELKGIETLRQLWMFDCRLRKIPNNFTKLKNLNSLVIDGFENLDFEQTFNVLKRMPNLIELDLSNLNIKQVPSSIKKLRQIEELGLDDNQLTELPPELRQLPNLKKLFLSSNMLDTFVIEDNDFMQLEDLNLCYNKFNRFPVELASLPKIKRLVMWHNPLYYIPSDIPINSTFKELNLSRNELVNIPEKIKNLKALESLDLHGNPIVNSSFQLLTGCYNLIELRLGGTKVKEIPVGIAKLSKLKTLGLTSTRITELNPELETLDKLETIGLGHLNGANWEQIFKVLANINSLNSISLCRMGIKKMPDNFKNLSQVEVFQLGLNKFNRDEQDRIQEMLPEATVSFSVYD